MEFYLIVNGQQQGPFTIDELSRKGLTPESEVWAEGMADWMQAGDVPELTSVLQQQEFNRHQQAQQGSTGTGATPPPMRRQAAQQPQQPQPQPAAQQPKQGGSGCTRWLLAGLILAILFGTMVFTCPSRRDHEVAIEQVTRAFVGDKVEQRSPLDDNSILGRMINELVKNVTGFGTDMAVSNFLDVDNYLVCSVGRMTVGNTKDKMVSLGVFGHVFTFDKEDLEKAWAQAMDKYEDSGEGGLLPVPQQQQQDDDATDDATDDEADATAGTQGGIIPDELPDSIFGVAVPEELDSMSRQMAGEVVRMAKEWAKKQIDELGK